MDDDANKHGKLIHGFRVFGGMACCRKSSGTTVSNRSDFNAANLRGEDRRDSQECERRNIELRRLSIRLETISDNPLRVCFQCP